MGKRKLTVAVLGILLILGAALAPAVWGAEPLLNDVWFKMKVTAKGHSFDPATGAIATKNFPIQAYMHFV